MKMKIGLLAVAALLASGAATPAGAHAIKTKGAGVVDCVPSAPVPDTAVVAAEPSAIKTKGAGANDRLGDVKPDTHRPPPCCDNARAPAAGSTESGSKTKPRAGTVALPNVWVLPVCHA